MISTLSRCARWVAAPVILSILAPALAAAQTADAERMAFLQRLTAAHQQAGAEAAANVLELEQFEPWIPAVEALNAYDDTLQRMPPGLARDLLAYRVLRLHEATGDLPARDEVLQEQGYLTAWSVIGPFPNDGMSGFSERYGPEREGVSAAEWDGRTGPVAWRELPATSESGYLDLADVVRPAFDAVAYVATDVTVPRATNARLGLAVDGVYRVWVNGEPVAEQPDHLGGFAVRDHVEVRLQRGVNQVLVKIAVDDTAMGLHARLTRTDGQPLAFDAEPGRAPGIVAEPSDEWERPSSPADRLSRPTLEPRDALTVAFVVQALQPADPSEPWRGLGLEPGAEEYTPWDHVRAASIEREHWQSMLWLDAAARASDDPWIQLAWVRAHRREPGAGPRLAAAAYLRDAVAAPEAPASMWLEWADMLREQGFDQAAAQVRETVYEAAAGALPTLWPMIHSSTTLERRHLLMGLHEQLVARDARSLGAAGGLTDLLLANGRGDEAELVVSRAASVRPLAPEPRLLQASVARARGDAQGALDAMNQLVALAPGDADAFEARGRLRLEQGDRAGAIADWEAALQRAPQNASLRDELERMQPETEDRFAVYRIEDDELRNRAAAMASETGAATLVDQRVIELHPNGLATSWNQLAWRVDTRQAADVLRLRSVTYTPDAELVELRALRVLKADGSVIDAYDVDDYNPQRGPAAMYFDARVRAWSVARLEPGDILLWEYSVDDVAYRNLFDDYYGDLWVAQGEHPAAHARYVIDAPADRPLHDNREDTRLGSWREREADGRVVRTYEAFDVPPIPNEGGAPGLTEIAEFVSVATAESWEDLATWYWQLVEDQLVVSPEIERTVAAITEGAESVEEIVAAVYGYVVRNTRYVGLEFGIHGYRPYRTTECFARRFGDCKDTASLIKVMLGVAGVDAHLVLVRTRDRGRVGREPPSLAVFNHAIAYVPALDRFLDGTAGFSGAIELPPGDQGATALIVRDGAGGELVEIPALQAAASIDSTTARISLRANEATATFQLEWSGAFASGGRRLIESTSQLAERLEDQLGASVPGAQVTSLEHSDPTDIERPVWFETRVTGGEYLSRQAGSAVLHPLLDDADLVRRLAGAERRELPLAFPHAFVIRQSYAFEVPRSWGLDDADVALSGSSEFGTWTVERRWDAENATLFSTAEFALESLQIDPERYAAFRDFVADADAAMSDVVRFSTGGDQ